MQTKLVSLLVVLAAILTPKAAAQSSGTFTATGNMTTPRFLHTATLLADGRVLIAGGGSREARTGAFNTQSSAELYDPRTGAFKATGNMITPRSRHTATLLPDGRVLIAGGGRTDAYAGALSSAELYDPSTGTFTAAGYAETNQSGPTATLMTNGKVLIAGGDIGDGDGGSFIAEHYDPATGAFSRTGNMTVGREQHTATLLPEGSVLFAGGHLTIDLAASAEIYDPIEGAFTRTANMPTAHELHTATLLGDGTLLVAGGFIPWPALTSNAEIYHPAAVVFAPGRAVPGA